MVVEIIEEACDLCIVGSGYAGINALNAATKYLPEHARVVVIGRERAWGGQWVDQYSFVRLHQPYHGFTAGERQWNLNVPRDHLATKKEILQHFENIAAACVREKSLDLVTLFQYEYDGHLINSERRVEVNATSFTGLPKAKISCKRMINARGVNIQPKLPFVFPEASCIHSLTPGDVSAPEWSTRIRYNQHKPVIVVGSGKTAMDVMLYLGRNLPDAQRRVKCISGRGTWFLVRELMTPTDAEVLAHGSVTGADIMIQMISKFNGSNAKEVCMDLDRQGLIHSAVPDPGSFLLGLCSREEISTVKAILSPAEEKIIKAHIVDVTNGGNGPVLKLRALDGESIFTREVEPGSFIINCTDNIKPQPHMPVMSDDGLVLNPQGLCGFTGPSANLCTHLFYSGGLEPLWRELPRGRFEIQDKITAGMRGLMQVIVCNARVTLALPTHVRQNYLVKPMLSEEAMQQQNQKFAAAFPGLVQKQEQLVKGRWTDEAEQPEELHILGGNLENIPRSRL